MDIDIPLPMRIICTREGRAPDITLNPEKAPQLHPEIVDMIIDHLHPYPDTLRSCSLTCRAWRPTSQLHFFHSIDLRDNNEVIRFQQLLIACPFIGSYVRDLTLRGHVPLYSFAAPEEPLTSDLAALALLIPNCEALMLHTHDLMGTIPFLQETFGRIKSLSIERCHFDDHLCFLEFVRTFPCLEHLSIVITSTSWRSFVDSAGLPDNIPRISVKSLHLGERAFHDRGEGPVDAILSMFDMKAVETLRVGFEVGWEDSEDLEFMSALCRAAGPSLKQLCVYGNPRADLEGDVLSTFNLKRNTHLQQFEVEDLIVHDHAKTLDFLLADLLESCPSEEVARVTHGLLYASAEDVRLLDFDRIDTVIGRKHLLNGLGRPGVVFRHILGAVGL